MYNHGYSDGEIRGRIRTTFINASATCISFAYNGYSPQWNSTGQQVDIKIIVADELGRETVLMSVRKDLDAAAVSPWGPDWYEHASALPDGVFRVIVEGSVDSRGAMAMIDDLAVKPCADVCESQTYLS